MFDAPFSKDLVAALVGGPAVVDRCMRRSCARELSPEQAAALWAEVKDRLAAWSLKDTVVEVERSTGGGLDTLERGDVLDALAWVITGGLRWPINADPEAKSQQFLQAMRSGLDARGYALLSVN